MKVFEFVLSLGAFVVIGLLCSFLVLLGQEKDEIWIEIKRRYFDGK